MIRFFNRIGLFLVGFTLPMNGVTVDVASLPMSPTKLVTFVILLMAGFQAAQARSQRRRDSKAVWVIAFGISYLLSSVVDFAEEASTYAILGDGSTHAALILFYFLTIFLVRKPSDLLILVWGLVLGGAATALPAVLGIETGMVLDAESSRFGGLAGHANILGRDMAVCLPLAGGLFLMTRSWLGRALLVASAIFITGGLLLSLSRSAFVTAVAMGGLWIVRSGRIENVKYAIPALLLGVGILIFSPTSVRSRWETVTDPGKRAADESIQSRFWQVEWAMRAFMANPVTGVGIQNYLPWCHRQPGGRRIQNVIHSGYLGVMSTQGLLGLIPYMMIQILSWTDYSKARRLARAPDLRRDRVAAELAHLAVFLQLAFFGTLLGALAHPATKAKPMWLLSALSTVLVALVLERRAELERAGQLAATEPEALAPLIGPRPSRVPG